MKRKLIKGTYLTLIKLFDCLIKTKTNKTSFNKKNIVLLMTFKEDMMPILDALHHKGTYRITLLYHPKYESFVQLPKYHDIVKIPLGNRYVLKHIKAIKSASIVVIDTYYLMLGSIKKSSQQEVIQVWHASSALKKFGLEDASVNQNDQKMIPQYKRVYNFTDSYVVAGSQMEAIFKRSLDAEKKQFLRFGLARLNQEHTIYEHDVLKQPILFLPTYRDYEISDEAKLNEHDIKGLIIRAHPSDCNYQTSSIIKNKSLDELIAMSRVVITDYSSLAVEAAYKGKPVMLFVPDEEKYHQTRGLNEAYFNISKKNKAYNKSELKAGLNNIQPIDITNWVNYQTEDALSHLIQYIEERVR